MDDQAPHCHPAYIQYMYGPLKGKYLGGSIISDQRGPCVKCGGRFTQSYSEDYERKVPKCEKCGSYPKKLAIDIYLPGIGPKLIRYDHKGERLEKVIDAVSFLRYHHEQIKNKTFDPSMYLSKDQSSAMRVSNFLELYKRNKAQECSHKTIMDIENICANYLEPHFGDQDIRTINYAKLEDFLKTYKSTTNKKVKATFRQKVKALETFRSVIKLAARRIPSITVPLFPELPKAEMRTKFIDEVSLQRILDNLTMYREAILTAVFYALRPCEVRALKWSDVDRSRNTITVQRHFSGNILMEGRKSAGSTRDRYFKLTLSIIPEFEEILNSLPRPLNPDEFIFKNIHGNAIGEDALRVAWKKAATKAKLPSVQMYEGTRHARATHLHQAGYSIDEIRALLGQTDSRTTERYAQSDTLSLSQSLGKRQSPRNHLGNEKVGRNS